MSGRPGEIRLISVEDLRAQGTFRFSFEEQGISREGFAAWFEGEVFAYENLCRHLPLSLDYGDGRFFSADGTHFVCQTHGALYEPRGGMCVAGPCPGTRLRKLEIEVREGVVWFPTPG